MDCEKPLIPYVSLYFKELMYICDGNPMYIEPIKKKLFVKVKNLPTDTRVDPWVHDGEESNMRMLYCRSSSTLSHSGITTPPGDSFGGRAAMMPTLRIRSAGHTPDLTVSSGGEEELDEFDRKCGESDASLRIQSVTMSDDLERGDSEDDVAVSVRFLEPVSPNLRNLISFLRGNLQKLSCFELSGRD
tara:strand:+ start:107 stop:670 length:564 start_codon:yes stop_codon:yes gene_type:complete